MARAYSSDTLEDLAGNKWVNARGTLYSDEAATVLVDDAYNAGSGGTLVTSVTTDAAGQYRVWFAEPKSYWVKWDDNGDTAYPAGSSPRSFATFVSKEKQAFQPAGDESTDDAALAGLVVDVAALTEGVGTYADMVAIVSPANRQKFYVIEHQKLYRYDAAESRWIWLGADHGVFYVDDYGATSGPVNTNPPSTGNWDAVAAAMQAAANQSAVRVGTVVFGVGRYSIDGELSQDDLGMAAGVSIKLKGTAGMNGFFAPGPQSYLDFVHSGDAFVADVSISSTYHFEDLYIQASDRAFWAKNGGGNGATVLRSTLATVDATLPAAHLQDIFGFEAYQSSFAGPAGGKSVWIDADAAIEAWYHRFKHCVFSEAGTYATISDTHSSITGEGCVFEDCFSENFAAGTPFYHLENLSAVGTTYRLPTFRRVYAQDAFGGTQDLIKITNNAAGALTCYGGILEEAEPATGAKHVRIEGTGTVNAVNLKYKGNAVPAVVHTAPGSFVLTVENSRYEVHAGNAGNGAFATRVIGDSTDRHHQTVDGTRYYTPGSGSLLLLQGYGAGSPESVVTASPGALYQDQTNGDLYVKDTGSATNTGWALLAQVVSGRLSYTSFVASDAFYSAGVGPSYALAEASSPNTLLQAASNTHVPLVLKTNTTPDTNTGRLLEIQKADGTVVGYIGGSTSVGVGRAFFESFKPLTGGVYYNAGGTSYALLDSGSPNTLLAAANAAHVVERIKAAASQTANLEEWVDSSDAILSRINKAGYFITKKNAAPADGDLNASEMALWFDDTNGAGKLMIKAKTANGTVVTGNVALT